MTSDNPTPREFLIGSVLALITTLIWAGWNIASRVGVGDALSSADIVYLRFMVAGLICLPIAWKHRAFYRTTPWMFLLFMICGAGAPYVWIASKGFEHASAAHGVLIPGSMLVWVALMSAYFLKESINKLRLFGYGLIGVVVALRLLSDHEASFDLVLADGMFMLAGFFWAVYTVTNKFTHISPVQALALVSVGSFFFYCVPYSIMHYAEIPQLPLVPSIKQMIYQGILVSFVAFLCYNKAITLIGPSRASAYAAAIPLNTVLLAMPIIGEYPTTEDWWFVGLLTLGVLFATGAMRRLLVRGRG